MTIKPFLAFLVISILSGCTTTNFDQHSYDNKKFNTSNGQSFSVSDLKMMHLQETGVPLATPETLSCGRDALCYYNRWSSAYDKSPDREKIKTAQADRAKEKEQECMNSPTCLRERDIAKYRDKLRMNYQYILAMNPYLQDDYDYAVRNMCEKSANAQSSGMPKETLLNNMRDVAGVSPRSRELIINVADACWNLSNLGSNWKEALRYN